MTDCESLFGSSEEKSIALLAGLKYEYLLESRKSRDSIYNVYEGEPLL
jgi:hypothetical protein